jgi:hypothetical protein
LRKTIPLLLFCSSAWAAPIGNPADPSVLEEGFRIPDRCWSSLRAGMAGDFMLLKRLRPSHVSKGLGISRPEMSWRLGLCDIGWNIRERFDLHVLAGPVAFVDMRWRQDGFAYQANSGRGLFWGGSSKVIILEVENTTVGVDFHGGGIEWMKGPLLKNGAPFPKSFSSRLYYWQLAGGLSQDAGAFHPYAGAAVNHFFTIFRAPPMKRMRLRDLMAVGMYEGCTLSFGTKIYLNIEARQFFESGLSIAGELRF